MTPLELATDATGRSASTEANGKNGAIYQTVWRLHFYAGLFVVPVVLLLAVTGAIYLFKPHLEPILYQDAWFTEVPQTSISPTSLSIDQQLRHAKAAYPEMRFSGIQRFSDPTRTTEFSARQNSQTTLVYLSPYSGAITGQIDRDQMLMRRVRNLHGELMLGTIGSAIVELAACWTVVLLTSGLYLWWPRGKSKWKGVFWPRRTAGKRIFWRDIHAVVAVYSSIIILTLIMTGLPWSNVWGGAFKRSLAATGQAQPAAASRRPKFQSTVSAATAIPVAKALEIAAEHGMTGDLSIKLPRGKKGAYSFAQQPLDLSQHRFLHLDQYTGAVLSKATWADFPVGAAAQTMGIRLHQGELFGVANLVIMLLACVALGIITVSGIVMWWCRRPKGQFAAPPQGVRITRSKPMLLMTILFAIFFPLVGASVVVFVAGEQLVNRSGKTE